MARSSKEKKGQLVLLKWRGTQDGIYVFMSVFFPEERVYHAVTDQWGRNDPLSKSLVLYCIWLFAQY